MGAPPGNTIKHWVRTGYLHGVQRNERLLIPLEEVERIQHDDQVRSLRTAAHVKDQVADLGLERLLTQEELDALSGTRPGHLPWAVQNSGRTTP
jgi:hypothetical protein